MKSEPKVKVIESGLALTNVPLEIDIEYAKKITLEFTQSADENGRWNARSGVLSVETSIDGTNYATFNKLIDNGVNSNSETIAHVASKTRATAGTDLLALDLEDFGFKYMKVTCTITDGDDPIGTFDIKAYIEY